MSDNEYMRRVRAMEGRLFRIAQGILWRYADSADAVQEAVLKAWKSRGSLRNEQYFETWLIRILINECHAIQRKNSRILPLEVAPEQTTAHTDPNIDLRDALLRLPEKLRMPVMLHYMEGYDSKDIARILRIPAGTVRTRLMRARNQLRDFLGEDD